MANDKKDKKDVKKTKRPTALKRDDQSKKRRVINKAYNSSVRTAIRKLDEQIEKKQADAIKASLNEVYSLMDKGIKTGSMKRNTAARTKSRLAARASAGLGTKK